MIKTSDANLGLHILEVEITNRCNLDCDHCYNRDYNKKDMPLEDLITLIELAEKNNVYRFVFSGGEASFYPEFNELTKYLKSREWHTKFIIQSNGAIGKIPIKILKSFDIVHLSFETEDECGVRKISVKETINTAKKLIKAGIRAYFFSTIHPGNIDKIDWMVEIANENSVDIGFNLCFPVKNTDKLFLSEKQTIEVTKKLYAFQGKGKILRFTSPFVAILNDKKVKTYCGIKGGCTAGIAACVILPNGDVCPCPFFRIKAGNVYDQSLEKIWLESDIFNTLRKRKLFEEPCRSCEYLSYCGGCRSRAFANSGKLTGFDPHCIKDKLLSQNM